MPEQDIPNFMESTNTELWRYREEHRESEEYHQVRKRAAQRVLLERAAELDATVIGTEDGVIEIKFSTAYSFDTRVVEQEFLAACREAGIEDDAAKHVTRFYKISKRWLDKMAKFGHPFDQIIERMTQGSQGSPSLKGPRLVEMGDYAPREEAEVR